MQAGTIVGNLASAIGITTEDAALVADLKAGSEVAFGVLIAQYHQPLYSLIARAASTIPPKPQILLRKSSSRSFAAFAVSTARRVCARGSIASLSARPPIRDAGGHAIKSRRSLSTRRTSPTPMTKATVFVSARLWPTTLIRPSITLPRQRSVNASKLLSASFLKPSARSSSSARLKALPMKRSPKSST